MHWNGGGADHSMGVLDGDHLLSTSSDGFAVRNDANAEQTPNTNTASS